MKNDIEEVKTAKPQLDQDYDTLFYKLIKERKDTWAEH